ncbi:MucR family transcriptional regulator [Cognatishimia sp.]|uniref:MucR family transcriptional regulator n=1 Tax=Cognatishimia sp. TaxID=2211648 RepID=UPI003BACA795
MAEKNNMDNHKKQNADAVATVVAAFAQRSDVTSDQIVELTARLLPVFNGAPAPVRTETAPIQPAQKTASIVPAIPLDQAVTDEKVYCLCCGKGFTMLKRHLKAEHGLTEEEYRQMFGLEDSFPLVAPKYSERKAAYAKQAGLGKYNRDAAEKEGLEAR